MPDTPYTPAKDIEYPKPNMHYGSDQQATEEFEDMTDEVISNPFSVDLQGHTNILLNLTANGGSDFTIEGFVNMQPGKEYKIIATNEASTSNELFLPASTLYNSEILEKQGGLTILYTFFTDGHSIYCRREVYSVF